MHAHSLRALGSLPGLAVLVGEQDGGDQQHQAQDQQHPLARARRRAVQTQAQEVHLLGLEGGRGGGGAWNHTQDGL